jgi:hypothetical protein
MNIKPIRGETDYERALRRVEELWDAPEGSAESGELIGTFSARAWAMSMRSKRVSVGSLEKSGADGVMGGNWQLGESLAVQFPVKNLSREGPLRACLPRS